MHESPKTLAARFLELRQRLKTQARVNVAHISLSDSLRTRQKSECVEELLVLEIDDLEDIPLECLGWVLIMRKQRYMYGRLIYITISALRKRPRQEQNLSNYKLIALGYEIIENM